MQESNEDELEERDLKKDVQTPPDLHSLVKVEKVILQAILRDENETDVVYSRPSTHKGNSLIYFYPDGSFSSPPVPGSIKYIFKTTKTCFTFAVCCQMPLVDGTPDLFRHYPHFPAKLYSTSLSDSLELVQVDWIWCHYACWQCSESHAVVLSLSRVLIPYHS